MNRKDPANNTVPARDPVDGRLSVIVRFHKRARLPLLNEALCSLAAQRVDDLEVVIATRALRVQLSLS
jgi:hypothetical protein